VVGQCLHYHVAGEVVALLVSPDEMTRHYSPTELAAHISRMCLAALGAAPPVGGLPKKMKRSETGAGVSM